MKIYVKSYGDYDRTLNLYVGIDKVTAEAITMQEIEGSEYYNAGGAMHTLEVWENGVKVDEIHSYIPNPDDDE